MFGGKVSIVVPVYNSEKYIISLVNSITSQSYQDFELIFVNDASTDQSSLLIKKLVEDDDRLILLEHEENMGAMEARKTGYLAAKGEYVMFCDSDDMLPFGTLEILVHAIQDAEADIVIGQCVKINNANKITEEWPKNKLRYGYDSESVYKSLISNEISHSLCGRIFKRSMFDSSLISKRNFNNAEDGLLFYQLVSRSANIRVIDDVVYYYRISPDANVNSNSKMTEKSAYSIIFFRNFIADYFKSNRELWDLYVKRYVLIVISLLRKGIPKRFVMDNIKICIDRKLLMSQFKGTSKIFVILFFYCLPFRLLINASSKK